MGTRERRRLRFHDELLDAQLLRTIGSAPYGGADIGECLAVADRIGTKGCDLERWYDEWSALAGGVAALAQDELVSGRTATARAAFFRASSYYRTAGVMLLGQGPGGRARDANRRQTEMFRAGAALLPNPPEILSIPFDGASLPGYFFATPADRESRPAVILIGGYDSTSEELYFLNGAAALERGYHVIAVDGPGQGASLLQHGLTLKPDFDRSVSATLDYLVARPEVDADRIVVHGLSLGAYLAPLAASADHRIAACIADCGSYDLFASAVERMPALLARRFAAGSRIARVVAGAAMRRVARQASAGWALRRGQLVHGCDSPLDYVMSLREFTLDGRAANIACPLLVCYADRDEISASAPRLAAAATHATLIRFTTSEGAGDHCQAGARLLFHARAFAWLDGVLHGENAS